MNNIGSGVEELIYAFHQWVDSPGLYLNQASLEFDTFHYACFNHAMGLFGPPDPEKLKNRRDIKGLVGALKYRGSAQVRKNAASALADLAGGLPAQQLEGAVGALIAQLEDSDSEAGAAAARALGAIGRPALLPLVSILHSASERSREGAAQAMGRLAESLPEATNLHLSVDPLITLLRDPSPAIRQSASWALGRVSQRLEPAQRSLPTDSLIFCLRDANPEVRESAVNSLALLGLGRAIRPLSGMLEDPSARVRLAGAEALETLGWQPNTPVDLARLYVAHQDWPGAVSTGSAAIPALALALGDRDHAIRLQAVQAIGTIASPDGIETLLSALKDEDGGVRAAAVGALEKTGAPEAIDALLAALRDPDHFVRIAVARALGSTRDARAIPALIQLLPSHEREIQDSASQALARLGSLATPHLIAVLGETDLPLVDAAGKILIQIGSDAVPALILRLEAVHYPINQAAAALLGQIGDIRAVRPLITALSDPNLASQAALALGKISDERAVKPLIEALVSPSDLVQQSAAQALGAIGDPSAVEPLLVLLRSPEYPVRLDSARALLAMYRSNKIGVAQKRKIIEQRERIIRKHNDTTVHQDENRHDWHMDQSIHDDSGIGLDFPFETYP